MWNHPQRRSEFLSCDARRSRGFLSCGYGAGALRIGATRRTKNGWDDRRLIGCHRARSTDLNIAGDLDAEAPYETSDGQQPKFGQNNFTVCSQRNNAAKTIIVNEDFISSVGISNCESGA